MESLPDVSMPRIDAPESYQAWVVYKYAQLQDGKDFLTKAPHYTALQRKYLGAEANFLGIQDPATEPDTFVEKHTLLMNFLRQEMNATLQPTKQTLIEKAAGHLASGNELSRMFLIERLTTRLAATTRVFILDALANSNDMGSYFEALGRRPVLTTGQLVSPLQKSDNVEDFHARVDKDVLAHELLHGMMTSGAQTTWLHKHYTIRNGVQLVHIDNPLQADMQAHTHASWLNDAVLESFRQTITGTRRVRYEPGVLVLHTLDGLAPGMRDYAVSTAFNSTEPATVFGEIEALLGPFCIEKIGELILHVHDYADLEWFKDAIVTMLGSGMRQKGRQVMEQKQEELFSWRANYHDKRKAQLARVQLSRSPVSA